MSEQKYSSAGTCVHTVSRIYNQSKFFHKGDLILDYGCGKYYNETRLELRKRYGVTAYGFDPFNQTEEQNEKAMSFYDYLIPDTIVCSNVLNVIKEDDVLEDVVSTLRSYASDKTKVLICVYAGDKSGKGKNSREDCWQRNQKTTSYLPLIKKYFQNVEVKDDVIVASGRK